VTRRPGVSKKTRFEVFKRDSFKCQYCGRPSPDVLLQVDHISPVSKGGEDDVLNLITSCVDCNLGKSDRELDDQSVIARQRAQLEELNERREQLEMMLQWREALGSLDEATIDAVSDLLDRRVGYTLNDRGRDGIRKLLRRFSLSRVLDAAEKSLETYIRRDRGGSVIKDSVETAIQKIGGVCAIADQPDSERMLHYVKGILRNRLSYVPPLWRVMRMLRAAVSEGADPTELKAVALDVRNWTEFAELLRSEFKVEE
jgi:hypothetical protein